jgi:predicted nucleic acid-binding protein
MTQDVATLKAEIISALDFLPPENLRLLREFVAFLRSRDEQPTRLVGLDLIILHALRQVEREAVPDMPDRIIAATALSLGLPLLTRDRALAAVEELEVIW